MSDTPRVSLEVWPLAGVTHTFTGSQSGAGDGPETAHADKTRSGTLRKRREERGAEGTPGAALQGRRQDLAHVPGTSKVRVVLSEGRGCDRSHRCPGWA